MAANMAINTAGDTQGNRGQPHRLSLSDRAQAELTGVVDVVSFDTEQILLETTRGMLTIKGKELHVSRLQIEAGELDVEGEIDSLVYTENGAYRKKQKGSLAQRLFQ